ncbi:hypothetical protein [Streptomyces cylindrosporus]|uniref:Uncharacterized protein n=1 Tax=Streptomyces cylindrosporus TaxID=2927583 RepID=A0ABS9Y1D9_9ACTN|nr:hypothetical protein [Streptomyces cylindrosporus]MCI3271043.1 hypothetical protein [Streptomyces cylindrosporus]
MKYEAAPLEEHGSTVQEASANLFRERWADGQPIRLYVSGTHRDGDNSATSGFVLEDRRALRNLIADLTDAFSHWPADHR